MSVILKGGASSDLASVDSNKQLKVVTGQATTPASVGATRIFSENDNGAVSGTAYLKSPETSSDYRLRVGLDTLLFTDTFNSAAQNTGLWKHTFTTMTMTQSAGFLNVNAAGTSTVANNSAFLQSFRHFPLIGASGLYVELTGQITAQPVANEVFMAGLGIAVAAAEPTDGCYFKLTSGGLVGVLAYNGTRVETGVLIASGGIPVNTNAKYVLVIGEREVEFWVDDKFLGEIDIPAANGQPFMTTALPLFIQKYNSGIIGSSPNMIIKIGDITVSVADLHTSKTWSDQMAGIGQSSTQGQNGGTMGTTALYPNATAATTVTGAALSQSAAIATGLGGQAGIIAAVPGIDGIVTGFQVPVGGVNQTPRTLYITDIRIDATNIGAAVATTASVISWSLSYGSTALALNTADTATFVNNTTKSHRRIPLGLQSWIVGAGIGSPAEAIQISFNTPIVVNPGEYVCLVAKFIQGTATASQVIWTVSMINGYYE